MRTREDYFQERFECIRKLQHNGASYAEIIILLTAILSACASYRWPKAPDKNRFIELLVKKSPSDFHMDWVSIPSLINAENVKVEDTKYEYSQNPRIFIDDEIDMPMHEAITATNVSKKILRQHCYASLIYRKLRCSYSHEYLPSPTLITAPITDRHARVSYIGRNGKGGVKRMAYFHLDFLYNITQYHIKALQKEDVPSKWWAACRE